VTQFAKTSSSDTNVAPANSNDPAVPIKTASTPMRKRERVIAVVFAATCLWYLTSAYGLELLRDRQLSGTWQVAYDMQAPSKDANCTRYQMILTICSAKLTSLADPQKAPVTSGFLMLFSGSSGMRLVPVRSTVDPSAMTIADAVETKLLNRTISWVVLAIPLLAVLLLNLAGLTRALARQATADCPKTSPHDAAPSMRATA
jgi:hypothetical protein